MKIVVLDGYTENPGDLSWKELESLGELTVYDRTLAEHVAERIKEADAIFVNKCLITKEIIAASPKLKYIGVLATGYNVVDVEAAKSFGVTVTNIPAYGTQAVAQFAIALLLEICGHVGHHSQAVAQGRWTSCPDWCFWDYPLIELAGKTIGIIGFGRIGMAVGRIAKALDMEVLAADPNPCSAGREIAGYVETDEIFSKSDVISLHCPLFPDTQGIICSGSIAKMKDGVIIINNSRGQLINEQDLADALNSGKVYAAGLDVVSAEPIAANNPLLSARNCLITPHISWASKESRTRLMNVAVENLRKFIAGTPQNVV